MNIFEVLIYIVLPLTFFITTIILCKKYIKEQKKDLAETRELQKDLNILEISYIYNNTIKEKDFKPFIVQLANEGYIKIIKDKNKYKIIKLKLPEDEIKLYFINELFGKYKQIDINERKDKILKIMNIIKKKVISKYEVNNVYEKKSLSKKSFVKFIILLVYIIILLKILNDLKCLNLFLPLLIIQLIGIKILFKTIISKKTKVRIIGLISSIILILFPIIILETKINNEKYVILYLISLVLIDAMLVLNIFMPKRKTSFEKLKNEIKDFEKFITDKNSIIPIIKQNNDYYYEIYPYSFIFNINEKMEEIKKILNIKEPIWYEEK